MSSHIASQATKCLYWDEKTSSLYMWGVELCSEVRSACVQCEISYGLLYESYCVVQDRKIIPSNRL